MLCKQLPVAVWALWTAETFGSVFGRDGSVTGKRDRERRHGTRHGQTTTQHTQHYLALAHSRTLTLMRVHLEGVPYVDRLYFACYF